MFELIVTIDLKRDRTNGP